MSFFSTTDIHKSLISGELIQSVVITNEFKIAMGQVDIERHVSKELIEEIIKNLFNNPKVKKQMRKMIVDVIFEMEWDDFKIVRTKCSDVKINNDCEE